MSPDTGPGVPHPPYEDLRSRIADEPAHAGAIDELHDALSRPEPDAATVEQRARRLRGIPALEATIANWWDAPATQAWVKSLTDAGL